MPIFRQFGLKSSIWGAESERRWRMVLWHYAEIDSMQREVETKAIETIARRQPLAVDLRELVSAFHIVNDLERIVIWVKTSASGFSLWMRRPRRNCLGESSACPSRC